MMRGRAAAVRAAGVSRVLAASLLCLCAWWQAGCSSSRAVSAEYVPPADNVLLITRALEAVFSEVAAYLVPDEPVYCVAAPDAVPAQRFLENAFMERLGQEGYDVFQVSRLPEQPPPKPGKTVAFSLRNLSVRYAQPGREIKLPDKKLSRIIEVQVFYKIVETRNGQVAAAKTCDKSVQDFIEDRNGGTGEKELAGLSRSRGGVNRGGRHYISVVCNKELTRRSAKMRGFMRHIMRITAVFPVVLLLTCGPNVYKMKDMPPREQFHIAKELFYKGDFANAQIVFDRIARLNIVSEFSDSAQYLLAESYYNQKSYILAESEYERLIKSLPGSPLVKDAQYKIGMCYYNLSPAPPLDQENTYKALRAFNQFLLYYPSDADYSGVILDNIAALNNKLADKQYYNGHLYYKMGNYTSAIIYFDTILRDYYNAPVASKALYEKSLCLKKLRKYNEARETLQIFIEQFPDDPLIARVNRQMAEIKNVIAKNDTVRFSF